MNAWGRPSWWEERQLAAGGIPVSRRLSYDAEYYFDGMQVLTGFALPGLVKQSFISGEVELPADIAQHSPSGKVDTRYVSYPLE